MVAMTGEAWFYEVFLVIEAISLVLLDGAEVAAEKYSNSRAGFE